MYQAFRNTVSLVIFAALAPSAAHALPASGRLFQQSYGYKVSCLLCHASGGGSAANGYGKAFLRSGANSSSFKKLEGADSDGDKIPNIKEILAKSNPGDRNSTLEKPGEWLGNTTSVIIPQKELEAIFPSYSKFSAIEGSLSTKQVEYLKSKLGRDPVDDDKVPTFYFAEKDGKRVAVGQFISEHTSEGKSLTTGVTVATSGKVLGVKLMGGSLAKSLETKESLMNTYTGKSTADLPAKPSDTDSGVIHSSVERSLWLIQAVFGQGTN
jgi:hypothetical protein